MEAAAYWRERVSETAQSSKQSRSNSAFAETTPCAICWDLFVVVATFFLVVLSIPFSLMRNDAEEKKKILWRIAVRKGMVYVVDFLLIFFIDAASCFVQTSPLGLIIHPKEGTLHDFLS